MRPLPNLLLRLTGWAHDLMPSCRQVTRLQSRALDESLPRRLRLGMSFHTLYCVWCRRYRRQLHFLRQALQCKELDLAHHPTHTLPTEARQHIKDLLRSHPN